MSKKEPIGIFFYHHENGHVDGIDYTQLQSYAQSLEDVVAVWDSASFPLWDLQNLVTELGNKGIERMVIAGHSPGMIKPFFARAMAKAGKCTDNVLLAGFREHNAITSADNEKAKAILACAVYGVSYEEAIYPGENDVIPDTLVIGGGIAGIQASLEIANGNQKVYLLEKTGTIGGHMAMFDKTFPTLDCAACILTPKMVDVGQHPNIEMLTYSEVEDISGSPGNYQVKILKKARRVNIATCIGCGTCSEKCPSKGPSEFDADAALRKAIYIPFPQAVPNKYLVDASICRWVQEKKCGVCVKVCPVPDCINLDEEDQTLELNVGNIVVTTGFKVFDAKRAEQYGYGKLPNVLTSLEFERLINAAGPTEGNIVMRSQDKKGNWIFDTDGEVPKSIALIHCIGSRDENYNKYCSKVCCMYSLKLAHLAKEKLPDAVVSEYYIDMRAFGKGYEEFYERIGKEGIHIIRGKTAMVEEAGKQLKLRSEDIENFRMIEQKVDMVVLAVGLEPAEGANSLADMLGITVDENGWYNESNYISNPVGTEAGGITIAGLCQGPKDIPDTVAQASAAAAKVLKSLIKGKVEKDTSKITLADIEKRAKELSTIMEDKS